MLYERLMKQLKEHKTDVENALLTSNIKDFNDYKYAVGRIRGLQDSLEILRETFKRANDED